MKLTGGRLKVRDLSEKVGKKISQIRIYSGKSFEAAGEIYGGNICAVTGLTQTKPGED